VANSIIQGLTTETQAELNRLPPFTTTVLLGLCALVDPKHPTREVCARPSDILEIVEVGKKVAHAVDRTWNTAAGEVRSKSYQARRYNPKYWGMLHTALRKLHDQTVLVQRWDQKRHVKLEDRVVHLLDMFGYEYRQQGAPVDIDDPPPGVIKVNEGTDERPLWRLKEQTATGDRFQRPNGILFRLNSELAKELTGAKGTIGFTILARRVFGVLRTLSKDPSAIRLTLLILRQTAPLFQRSLEKLLQDLGWDPEHPTRALGQLEEALKGLQALGVIQAFTIDQEQHQVAITRNESWHRGAAPADLAG
jgi:hypothetical protein